MGKKFGDRKDGTLLRKLDAIHFIMPLIYPNRCDNEAFISQRIDLTNLDKYIAEKNSDNPKYKYTLFQAVVSAVLKVVILRPKMNRFIANGNYYQRNEASASFIVKKIFSDNGEEGMAYIRATKDYTIDSVHDEIFRQVSVCRSDGGSSGTDDALDIFNRMPRFLAKLIVKFICFLDRHGKVPQSVVESDPYYASAILSNLGSIKLKSGYHHLTNWGTTSIFVVVGERKFRPFYRKDGSFEMKNSIDLGLTVDERIGDGYYFSKTVRLLKKLLENPELLDKPFGEEVEYYGRYYNGRNNCKDTVER